MPLASNSTAILRTLRTPPPLPLRCLRQYSSVYPRILSVLQSPRSSREPERSHCRNHQKQRRRSYYTPTTLAPPPYPPIEAAILSAAYNHVPSTGFTKASLTEGATDAGYLPASTNLFTRGAFDLVVYHLVTQRLALKDRIQFPEFDPNVDGAKQTKPLGTGAKVRALLLARLRANDELLPKLPEALGHMSLLGNIPASVAELARLVDEIWYLAGDKSVDTSWYTKRGLLAGVYASSEMFMTQDKSKNFRDTEAFVDRRLEDVMRVGKTAGAITEWSAFTGLATVNVLRSWGARI